MALCPRVTPWVLTPSGMEGQQKTKTNQTQTTVSLGRRKLPIPIFDLIPFEKHWTKQKHRPFRVQASSSFCRLPVIFHLGPIISPSVGSLWIFMSCAFGLFVLPLVQGTTIRACCPRWALTPGSSTGRRFLKIQRVQRFGR